LVDRTPDRQSPIIIEILDEWGRCSLRDNRELGGILEDAAGYPRTSTVVHNEDMAGDVFCRIAGGHDNRKSGKYIIRKGDDVNPRVLIP